jgi:hypothetical protein
MNAGVSLVQAYLGLNGYLTVTEFPVIRGRRDGAYEEITDLDALGVRFPDAQHVIPRGRPGPEDDLRLEVDPVLAPATDAVDVVIAEVKEGKARLNLATREHDVLYTALSRVGCVLPALMERAIEELQARGETRIDGGAAAVPSRIRIIAFGDGQTGPRPGFVVVSLEHVAAFVNQILERYHYVLHPADLSDPVLGLLHLLRKLS